MNPTSLLRSLVCAALAFLVLARFAAGNAAIAAGTAATATPTTLRVLSFNIWMGGGKPERQKRTFEVVEQSGADIAGIQEPGKAPANFAAKSDGKWHHSTAGTAKIRQGTAGSSVLSKFPIVAETPQKLGAKIKITDTLYVWIFNTHLFHAPYEAYLLNGLKYGANPIDPKSPDAAERVVASAAKARAEHVKRICAEVEAVRAEGWPVFVTGDFNEPSHLDWTPRAAAAGLHKLAIQWPASSLFAGAGLRDSYRVAFPDEVKNPGYTWTPKPAKREVHDRIDFVMFHPGARRVTVKKVEIVGEKAGAADIVFKNYPSDHRAVLATFEIE